MDRYLIDLLLDQVLRGNKIGCAFITQAWNEMVKSFNSKFGSHYDKEVLKSRYKHLRQQYSDVKILLDQSGFSWDENQEMVTAEEYVWDSFTKVNRHLPASSAEFCLFDSSLLMFYSAGMS